MRKIDSMLSCSLPVLCALWLSAVPADAQRSAKAEPAGEAKFIQQVIELTNRARAKAGAPPLKQQETLCAAARWMAQDMASHDYFDHTDHQGREIAERFQALGYQGFNSIGENIAAGQLTPEQVVASWMQSPGHRRNLLSPDFSEVGIGFAQVRNSHFRRYWVQDLGSRSDVSPVLINRGALQASSPEVKLYLYGEEWALRMRLSNDGVHWTDWQPFQADYRWRLEPGSGKRTVYVELTRNEETRRSTASIQLNQETLAQNPSPSRTH
jgi:uncharacterized protein YkwD